MNIPIVGAITEWYCPNCGKEEQTQDTRPHIPLHTCPKLAMLSAPLVKKGTSAKVLRLDREDYVGREVVQKDGNGRPVMSIVTVRDDGQDTRVFAPSATNRP